MVVTPAVAAEGLDSALAFARRRRIGPFATVAADRAQREKQIAAMIRAGHSFTLARRIALAEPDAAIDLTAEAATSPCEDDEPC